MKDSNKANKRLVNCGFAARLLMGVAAICVVTLGSARTASAENLSSHPAALTESGRVAGLTADGVNEFLGIPYAAPPVGALRWTPPKPYGVFPGHSFQATQFGSECSQPGGGSEDCLFLNVYTPQEDLSDAARRPLPVMVWIHGGALETGTSALYDPSQLVKKGVIVVTINYRLGYLGFFAQSAIDAEGHLNGNYGLMDQQFALQWVRRNIAGFGGDPDRVTIFGESAGGQSVLSQLASPLAKGLFREAISESGAYTQFQDYYSNILTLAQGETTGNTSLAAVPSGAAIADAVGCASQTAACLRAVPAAALDALEPPLALFPFVDGKLLPQTISAAIESGEFNRVPVISGTNHDEWRVYVAGEYDFTGNPILNSAEYDAAVTALEGPVLEPTLVAVYPYSDYSYGGEALGAVGTDGLFSCPARNADRALSKYVPTYTYEFNDENAPPSQAAFGGLLTFPLGAYHTAELQYLFHMNAAIFGLPQAPLSPEQEKLSDAMVAYWTQFAKTGDPNSLGEPLWFPYNASSDRYQSLIPPRPVVESDFDADHKCSSFWDTF
jgi:para-nitrobenzyl esterase